MNVNRLKEKSIIVCIMSTETQETSTQTFRFTGRVKWFNNKAGYGFITVTDSSDKSGADIFVHHTGVMVDSEQYKYLVQGEYVSFDLKKMSEGEHEFHAFNVRGVHNGILMCETRNENRATRGRDDEDGGDWHGSTSRSTNTRGAGGHGFRRPASGRGGYRSSDGTSHNQDRGGSSRNQERGAV